MLGGRAAAKPEPHARTDEFDGAGGGGTFEGFESIAILQQLSVGLLVADVSIHVAFARGRSMARRHLPRLSELAIPALPGSDRSCMVAPTVVFDLDGTLVDTAPDLVATLNVIFAREGLPPVAYEAARNMVGGGARGDDRARARGGGPRPSPPAEVDRLVGDFIAHYAAHIADRSRPFPGLEEALDGWRPAAAASRCAPTSSNGCRCGCSMRSAYRSASSPFAEPTPSGCKSPIRNCCGGPIARADGDPRRAVMVGDSIERHRHRAGGRHSGGRRRLRLYRDPGARVGRRTG